MKINNDVLYGFNVVSKEYISEVDATLYDMTHQKSGARLLFLDRDDENTTFAIGFKTTPTDDTGVFHIIEHSVLCGSEKFPIKDPLTELLKGSVSTYLNALTSGDKTLYPVSSKNSKAFHGLVDVYLDAVFNPLVLSNPFIFMQEGYRYEIDEEKNLSITGVVYNEMKGVYSTADDYADYLVSRRICPGGTYSYDSGGNPDFIPDLTYEALKEAHKKFYHPSNAYLFLDGNVIIDDVFPLIDSYLSKYEKKDSHVFIDDGGEILTETEEDYYPIEKEDEARDKNRLYLCYNSYAHKERERLLALSFVTEALADLNTAPLTKIILDSGLCESFTFYTTHSYSLNSLNVTFAGVKDGKEEELIKIYEDALKGIINSGIPKDVLSSALKRREFNTREADYGSFPPGMVYMRSCIEAAMLNESPADSLRYENLLAFLREKLDTGYYEQVISDVISSKRATLILHPDSSFSDKKEAELGARLKLMSEQMTDNEKSLLAEQTANFYRWQSEPDSIEALSSIPSLKIEDLNTEPKKIPSEIINVNGCEVILHPLHTNGIAYLELYFDASDADEDELHYIRLFTDLISEWNTEIRSVTEFRTEIKNRLGTLFLTPHPTKRENETKLYLTLNLSCLQSEKRAAADIVREYLYSTLLNDKEALKKSVRQQYTYSLESITARGDTYAILRDCAKHSSYDATVEHLFGCEYHLFIKNLMNNIDTLAEDVLARLENIRSTYFRRERLTVGLTEQNGEDFAKIMVEAIKDGGKKAGKPSVKPIETINEGVAVPSSVSFTARTGNMNGVGENLYTGAFSIIQSITSLEILWNEIRLKNGAYDTGFFVKASGAIGSYSYRDPSPLASVEYFGRVCDEIAEFLDLKPDLLKYVIGIFGSGDPVTTPRNDGSTATKRHLSGKTHELIVQRRKECLNATHDELNRLNEILRKALLDSTFTVVGPRDEIEKIAGVERILDI